MNIFFLGLGTQESVEAMADVHVNKMLLEYVQLLCTTWHIVDPDGAPQGIYKKTHENHPCAVWVRESVDNYIWLNAMTALVALEWKHRKKIRMGLGEDEDIPPSKIHKSIHTLELIYYKQPVGLDLRKGLTLPPSCMDDEYKIFSEPKTYEEVVGNYQNYYRSKRKTMKVDMKWTGREEPQWMKEAA